MHAGTWQLAKYVHFNDLQKSVLQESFKENAYPTKATLRMLGEQLCLSESRVDSWFNTKRRCVREGEHVETSSIGENIIHVCTHKCPLYL